MIFRRVLAVVLILVYIAVSVLAFVMFGLSNTVFSTKYYEEKITGTAYEFVVNVSTKKMLEEKAIKSNFDETEIKKNILNVFPYASFKKLITQVTSQVDENGFDPEKPLVIKLGALRESLLTLTHTLSYSIFEKTRKCEDAEIPKENEFGIPECIPKGVEYNMVFGLLDDKFERAVYNAVPEQIQVDLNTSIGQNGQNIGFLIGNIEQGILIVYVGMVVIVMLIALIIYKPFSTIMTYEGITFALSGLFGLVLKQILNIFSFDIADKISDPMIREEASVLIGEVIGNIGDEIQKAALISLVLGIALIILRLFIRHKNV